MEQHFHEDYPHPPEVAQAMHAATDFLTKTLNDVQRVEVIKVSEVMSGEAAWDVEANVWQQDPEIKKLALHTFRPVCDESRYLVRLDAKMNVLEYELHELAGHS